MPKDSLTVLEYEKGSFDYYFRWLVLVVIGYRSVVGVVGFGFKYLTALYLFLLHLTCQLYLWKAAREFKEGRKETKIPFEF